MPLRGANWERCSTSTRHPKAGGSGDYRQRQATANDERRHQQERLPRTAAVQRLSAIDRGTALDGRPGGAAAGRPADAPTDLSPYEWLWPYGDDSDIPA